MDRDVDSGEEGEQKTPEEVLQYQEIEEGTSINCVKYWYCYYPRIWKTACTYYSDST